jgi:hypothetical protein
MFLAGAISRPFLKAKKIAFLDSKSLPQKLRRPENADFRYYCEETQAIEPSSPHFYCKKVYVLMDCSNFSSSESFVHFCKATGFATLVGQRSSGDGTLNYECGTEPDIALDSSVDAKEYVRKLVQAR